MRWHWLVGAVLAIGIVACGDDDSDSSNKTGSGGSSSKTTSKKGSGGTSKGSAGEESAGTNSSETGGDKAGSGGSGGTDTSGAGSGGSVSASGGTDTSAGGSAGADAGPAASSFVCSGLGQALASDASDRKCYDFSNSADLSVFAPDGGTWTSEYGGYLGKGPGADVTCVGAGSMFTASTLKDFNAADVRVHAKLTSLARVDKAIVLRAKDSGNRIEFNFRAGFVFNGVAGGNDLVIQELVNCQVHERVAPGVISIPHTERQNLSADIELRGQQCKVTVDGKVVFNDTVQVTTTAGSVGFAAIFNSVALFDDFVVETLK